MKHKAHVPAQPSRTGLRHRQTLFFGLLALPMLYLVVFYFYPLGEIFRVSLRGMPGLEGGSPFPQLFSRATWHVLGFTFWQAALSTVLTLIFGLPGAYIFARYEFPGKSLFNALTTVPFVLPAIVVAMAFSITLGPHSYLNVLLTHFGWPTLDWRYSLPAILTAHIFYNYSLVLRMVGNFWANLDPQFEEAARTLGASPWRAFREVTWPLLLPVLRSTALMIFIFCFTSFGVVLILGGPHYATLEVEIYRQTIYMANLPLAAGLSLVQLLSTLLLTFWYTHMQSTSDHHLELRPRWSTQHRPRKASETALISVIVVVALLFLSGPLLSLSVRSFRDVHTGKFSLAYYSAMFTNPRRSIFYVPPSVAVRNSLHFALATMSLALLLGMLASLSLYRHKRAWVIDALFMLPLGTSSVTLGLGYILAMGHPPLNLQGTPTLIVLAHTLIAMPFVVRNLMPALQAIRPALREAAATLGASPRRTFVEVDLPIVERAMAVGAMYAFTVSMGEFGATSMLTRPDIPTIPIAIYRYLSKPGAVNYGQALAMSTLLMAVCIIGFVVMEHFRLPGEQSF